MDVKDLRTEAAPGDRNNDGSPKYQGSAALPCPRNKTYQDIGSNSLGKVDAAPTRPCAVIGPDRVVPPPASTEAYLKKGPTEPWLSPDNTYRRPPEYPHKLLDFQHPTRNISPRQTFQENMQRIMVPPTYNSVKLKEDHNFLGDANITQMRNNKLSVPSDPNPKYCDVPYNVNPMLNEQKTVRNPDISVPNMNSVLMRSAPHGWTPTSANVRPSKTYPQDLCQYPEYPSCAGPRPMVMSRPHRTVHEEPGPVYPDPYYHDGNIRYKPYPSVKDRYPQARYEYISNYPNPFHPPPPFPTHKYDLQKPMPPHPYPGYSQVPIKYLDGRMGDPMMNGYQRSLNPQANYNSMTYRNQMVHPSYGPVPANCLQTNKFYPYPPDASKSMPSNKLPYADTNGKIYPEYENSRPKNFPMSEGFYVNDITRTHHVKTTGLPTGYLPNIHGMPTHPYYRKESMKGYEYNPHFRNIDPTFNINGNLIPRFATQFSPNSIAISPSDSNASNDTNQTQGTLHEDFGYVSQSSSTSVRSFDSGINRVPHEYRRFDHRYSPIVKPLSSTSKNEHSSNGSKNKKEIDVRQFLQMWNEGEEEGGENAKEVIIQTVPNNIIENANMNNFETSSQEQLYVLGLVNVPSEELAKYEHIQKVSKLPENIKGYNNIELLHQFEEIIESTNLNNYTSKPQLSKDFHTAFKATMPMHGLSIPSRPLSPLDVEAKISQSVIHKDVGCNFEIKPCSPKMLNVEIATPVHSVMNERIIEKVSNPLGMQSPTTHSGKENRDNCKVVKCQDRISTHDNLKIASCKMVHSQYNHSEILDPTKTNYSIQDFESNSGVCLASLPRLDNDIELNFPEVNQQFINANKVESVITPTTMKDLPPLDLEQCDTTDRKLGSNLDIPTVNVSENDYTKLSKYRKLKRKGSDTISSETNVQALRTDSVIIKNPENIKTLDKNSENCKISVTSPNNYSPTETKCNETQENPINLSVTTDYRQNSSSMSETNENKLIECKHLNMAIDFSTNSNENKEITCDSEDTTPSKKERSEHQDNILVVEDQKKLSNKSCPFDDDENIRSILEGKNNTTKLFNDLEINKNQHFLNSENLTSNSKKKKKRRSSSVKNKHNQISSEVFEELIPQTVEEGQINQLQLSGYSTPDTEDSINVKMRELFGELSSAETEPSFSGPREDLDGISTISDDDMIGALKESSDQVSNHSGIEHGKENQGEITQKVRDVEKILSTPDFVHDIPNKKYKKSIFDMDDEPIKSPAKTGIETQKSLDSPSCLVNTENEKDVMTNCSTSLHISKELLSPWIQKLIVHTEGLCVSATENDLVNSISIPSYIEEKCMNNTLINNLCSTSIEKITETKPIELEFKNEVDEKNICPVVKETSGQQNNNTVNQDIIDVKIISINDTKSIRPDEEESPVETLDDNSKNYNSPLLETCFSSALEEKYLLESVSSPTLQDTETIYLTKSGILPSEDITIAKTENCESISTYDDLAISSPKSQGYVDLTDSFESSKESSDNSRSHSLCNTTENSEDISDTNNEFSSKVYSNLNLDPNKNYSVSQIDDSIETNQTPLDSNLKSIEIYECKGEITSEPSKKIESPTESILNSESCINKLSNDILSTPTVCLNETVTEDFSSIDKQNSLSENVPIQRNIEAPCKDSPAIVCLNETFTNDFSSIETENCLPENEPIQTNIEDPCEDSSTVCLNETFTNDFSSIETENCLPEKEAIQTSFEGPCEDSATVCVKETFNEDFSSIEKQNCISENELNQTNIEGPCQDSATVCLNETVDEDFSSIRKQNCLSENKTIQTNFEGPCEDSVSVCFNETVTDDFSSVKKQNCLSENEPIQTNIEGPCEYSATVCFNETVTDDFSSVKKQNCLSENESNQTNIEDPCQDSATICSNKTVDEDFSAIIKQNYLSENEPIQTNIEGPCQDSATDCFNETVNEDFSSIEKQNCISENESNQTNIEDPCQDSATICSNKTVDEDFSAIIKQNYLSENEPIKTNIEGPCEYSATVCFNETVNEDFSSIEKQNCISENEPNQTNIEGPCQDSATDCFNETVNEDFSSIEKQNCISENEPNQTNIEGPCEDSATFCLNEGVTEEFSSVKKQNIDHLSYEDFLDEPIVKNHTLVSLNTNDSHESNHQEIEMSNHLEQSDTESQEVDGFYPDFDNTIVLSNESKNPIITDSPHQNEISVPNESLGNEMFNSTSEIIVKDGYNRDKSLTDTMAIQESLQDSGIVDDDDNDIVFESMQNEHLCQGTAVISLPSKEQVDDFTENARYSHNYFTRKRRTLKRSLSDTALNEIQGDDELQNISFLRPAKRKKNILNSEHETRVFAENICQVIQNHRRNSISSMQNEENVSFCILIDNNGIITEDGDESDKICFSEVPEDCIACVQEEPLNEQNPSCVIQFQEEFDCYEYPSAQDSDFEPEKSTEPWLEDIACVETVVSDDIAENIVISASTSPRNLGSDGECGDDETEAYVNEHTDKLKCIYGDKMHSVDAHFVDTLYRTPQMNVDKTLNNRESHFIDVFNEPYDTESLQDILLGSTLQEEVVKNSIGFECTSPMSISNPSTPENSPNHTENIELDSYNACDIETALSLENKTEKLGSPLKMYDEKNDAEILQSTPKVKNITSCESSIDDVLSSKKSEENSKSAISSSPEVSSTTSEEKSTGILLKITNYSGSRVAQVTDSSPINSISCKYTEKKDYLSSNGKQYLNPNLSTRPLLTKAAQKYIPPLRETIPDLKIKLPLPPHRLIKLKKMKMTKEMPKSNEDKTTTFNAFKQEGTKKAKPKFEDVLKSIDEIQYQKHKEKSKKVRKSIPKVVIKKNEYGSHYASTSCNDNHNPDLTGRKWQPWVFLEKNHFIDKMALKKKTIAIFSHRKNCYVLAEKFYKYKSVSGSSKFVISQPKLEESTSGQLKYTIRLKHQY